MFDKRELKEEVLFWALDVFEKKHKSSFYKTTLRRRISVIQQYDNKNELPEFILFLKSELRQMKRS